MSSFRRAYGFTLIELMIVVTILGIVMAIGVPSFSTMIKNNRLTATVNDLAGALHYARAEAVRRGRSVEVSSLSSDVSNGLRIWFDTDGDNSFDNDNTEELRVLDLTSSDIALAADMDGTAKTNVEFSYNSQGAVGSNLTIVICDDRTGSYGKQMQLLASGIVRLTSSISCNEVLP